MKSIFTYIAYFGLVCFGYSQNDTTGTVITDEIIIEKNKDISLPERDKPFVSLPFKKFQNQPFEITISDYEPVLEWPDYPIDAPLVVPERSPSYPPFQNYVKAGFGNYSSPLIRAEVYHTIDKIDFASQVFYESYRSGPINGENSASNHGALQLSAHVPLQENLSIQPGLEYRSKGYRFYGSTFANPVYLDGDLKKVVLGTLGLKVPIDYSTDGYQISLQPGVIWTNQGYSNGNKINQESEFFLLGDLAYDKLEEWNAGIGLEIHSSSFKSGFSYNRSLVSMAPWASRNFGEWKLKASFAIASSSFDGSSDAGFFPSLQAEYPLSDQWSLVGILGSGFKWANLDQLGFQNEFLSDSLLVANQKNKWNVGGKLKGAPSEKITMEVEVDYSKLEGLPFYVPSDASSYEIAYDEVDRLKFGCDLIYIPTATNQYYLQGELNNYSNNFLDAPWHYPAYQVHIGSMHKIGEKITVGPYIKFFGGIEALPFTNRTETRQAQFTGSPLSTNLDPVFDLNVKTTYELDGRLSVFLDAYNLTAGEYERYLGYPVRGLSFKFGGIYRF